MGMIHNLADVKSEDIGEHTTIWQFCVILKGAKIGANCNINCHVLVEGKAIIGNNVTVKPGVQIWDGVTLEDNVFIGPNVTFTNDSTPRSKKYPSEFETTLVKNGASIGANATIMAGHTIGEYALIGAGSVVTKDVPPFSVYYGNPAQMRGYITRNGIVLDLQCKDKDGKSYAFMNEDYSLVNAGN